MEFEAAPPSTGALVMLLCIAGAMLLLAALFGWIAWGSTRSGLVIESGAVRVRIPFYGRTVPITSLDLDRAAVVDLGAGSTLRPRLRTNGIGLPGYAAGWFRLADGTKALMSVSRRREVLYVPTREGFALLLGLEQPARALERLRSAAGG